MKRREGERATGSNRRRRWVEEREKERIGGYKGTERGGWKNDKEGKGEEGRKNGRKDIVRLT